MKNLPVFKSEKARAAVFAAYETALARWPTGADGASCERLRVSTAAGETAVLAFGPSSLGAVAAAVPLILLHGAGANSSMWLGDAAMLSRDRPVFAVDIPGEPGMSSEARLEWNTEACGAWLAEVVAALGLREHAVLGLSLGAWIGLAYAVGNPTGLRALALLCPSGIGRTRGSFIFKAMLAMARGRTGIEALSRSLYGDFPPPEEAIRVGTLLAESTNPRMEKPRIFTDRELTGIETPIFLAVGTKDGLLRSKESAERLRNLQPDAEILVLPGAGHALIGLGEKIAEFLARR
jgi:pimeloyl-ACP methyl ester carboxylesterase